MKQTALLCGTALVAACATSPHSVERYAAEPSLLFSSAPDAPAVWAAQGIAGQAPAADWLGQFEDPTMIALIAEAINANPTLESRAALARASAAFSRAARAQRLPSLSASLSAGGSSTGQTVLGRNERLNTESFGYGLDTAWEADIWGRIASNIGQAEADQRANEADLAATALSIAGQTAIAWINLNEALIQERIAKLTYDARLRALNLTERRVVMGAAGALEMRTARSALAGAEAAIAARRQVSGESARRLELLLGRYPSAEIAAPAELPQLGPMAVEGNPALLFTRRPDVSALEARVVAAGLRAEEARLAMLPALRLTGSVTGTGADLGDAFDPALAAARLVASLSQPLFTGGRLRAQQEAAIAQAEAAVANYAAGVISAWREVENALAADLLIAQQEEAQFRAYEEALMAEEIAERQFSQGTVNIFNLIDAQTRRLTAESQLVSARASRGVNRVQYHLALGGGVPPVIFAGETDLFDPNATDGRS